MKQNPHDEGWFEEEWEQEHKDASDKNSLEVKLPRPKESMASPSQRQALG